MAKHTTLRQLAKEHAEGSLDRDSYRKSRAEYLQGLVSGEISLQEIDYPPPVKPPEPEALDTTERREEAKRPAKPAAQAPAEATAPAANPPAGQAEPGSNRGVFIGIAIALSVIILLAFSFMGGEEEQASGSSPQAPVKTGKEQTFAPASAEGAGDEVQQLIQSFLDKNNWSADSLQQFQQHWTGLASQQLSAARNSPALGKMTNAIYRQLLEEQALAGLVDDDSSLNKQRQLVEFARSLGIEDERFKLPKPPEP